MAFGQVFLIQLAAAVDSLWPLPGFGQFGGAVMLRIGMVMIRFGSQDRERILGDVLAEAGHRVLVALVVVGPDVDVARRAQSMPMPSSWLMIASSSGQPPTSLLAFSMAALSM